MALGDPIPFDNTWLSDAFVKEFQEQMFKKIDEGITLNYVKILDPSGINRFGDTYWTTSINLQPPTPMKFHKRYKSIKCNACGKFFKDKDMGIQACPSCGVFG